MSIIGSKLYGMLRLMAILAVALLPVVALALNIDSTYKYAWGENIGWLNWGTTEGDVDVSTTGVDGYVWGENVGWISLTCSNTSSCGSVNYGVSRSGNELSGYAWGENVGWISFACENTSSCGTVDYGVEVDASTGAFSGYAWGENVGWISLNCADTSSCGSVDFKVLTSVTTTPTPSSPAGVPVPIVPPPVTATQTPGPSISPTISAQPTPPVQATPTATPPISTPTTSPFPTPTTSPSPNPIEQINEGLDALGQTIFGFLGNIFNTAADACNDDPVQAGACASTAITGMIALLGIIAALLQHEIAATTFSLLQIVGLKKKARVWGTIYDSRTKRPVPLVKVELFDAAGRVLETRYADRDGRYGFLLSPAMLHAGQQVQITIRTEKPGYQFPSKLALPSTDYFVYDHVYQGGPITVRSDSVLTFNIPMDSTGGFRASFSGLGRSLTGPLMDRVLNIGFYLGLILVPLNLYLAPNLKNLIILGVFTFANFFRIFAHYRPYGMTVDAQTGERMPFALITLNEPGGRRVAFAVSDEFGRYILSAERHHEYELIAHTPANIAPQRETRERITLGSGWMTDTIKVGKTPLPQPPQRVPEVPQPSHVASMTSASGLWLASLFALFAAGIAAGKPRLPVGTLGQGVDEAYMTMHPLMASFSQVLHENTPIIEIMATLATATVLAGAVLSMRELFLNWLRGRRGAPPEWIQTGAKVAFLLGVLAIPLSYAYQPTAGRAVLGILFFAASGMWAHAVHRMRN